MCTGISITSKEGNVFFGRTMDLAMGMFGEDPDGAIPTVILTLPKNHLLDSQLSPWQTKYTTMGMGVKDTTILYDGINDQGLSGDTQVLMETTRDSKENIQSRGLIPLLGEEFVTYILSQYASVQEIKANYKKFALVDTPFMMGDVPMQFPLHYTFIDPTGEQIVLEPTDNGAFVLYDGIGVVTNSPEYSYHTTNIRNYISLSNYDPTKQKQINEKYTMQPIEMGTGYGMFGLPGDYTSPSRFVRAFLLSNALDSFEGKDGINQLYSVFRAVIIPRGLEHASATSDMTDYSRYWVGYDLTNQTMYVQTGEGIAFTAKKIDLSLSEINYENVNTTNSVTTVL